MYFDTFCSVSRREGSRCAIPAIASVLLSKGPQRDYFIFYILAILLSFPWVPMRRACEYEFPLCLWSPSFYNLVSPHSALVMTLKKLNTCYHCPVVYVLVRQVSVCLLSCDFRLAGNHNSDGFKSWSEIED